MKQRKYYKKSLQDFNTAILLANGMMMADKGHFDGMNIGEYTVHEQIQREESFKT